MYKYKPCIGDCTGPDELHLDNGELSVLLPGGVGIPLCPPMDMDIPQLNESKITYI